MTPQASNQLGLRPLSAWSPSALLAAFGVVLALAIAIATGVTVWHLRENAFANAEREVSNLNHVLAEATSRAVQGVDLLLLSTAEWLQSLPPERLADGAMVHAALRARLESVPQASVLTVTDGKGNIVHSTRSYPAPRVEIADVPNFYVQRDSASQGLYIDAPRRSKVDGRWSLYFSRSLRSRDGAFRGVVNALVHPSYFEEFYRDISLWEGSAVALFRADGILLTRYPFRDDWMGRSFAHGEVYSKILSKAGRGVVRTHSVVDDVDRIISGQMLSDYPLAVNVSVTREAALKEWRRWAVLIAMATAAALLVHSGLIALLAVQFHRRERIGHELAASEARLREAQSIAHLGSWSLDTVHGSLEWSAESSRIFGWLADAAPADFPAFVLQAHEDDRAALARTIEDVGHGTARQHVSFRALRADGQMRWIELAALPILGPQGDLVRIDGTVLDVTERHASAEKLRLAASVFERSTEANMVVDHDGHIVSVNQAFTRITGYSEHEVLGRNPSLLKSGRHDAEFYRAMWKALRTQGHWQGEIWNRRKSGEVFPEHISIEAVRDSHDEISHYIAIFSDISERKAAEDRLQHLAYFDPLTGLPNRTLLADRIVQVIASAARDGRSMAILFLDLDRFKNINDSLGHHAGDLVLQAVAARVQRCVRDSDTVARHGGDEFIVVLAGTDAEGAARVAQKIIDALSRPLAVLERDVSATPSIGISLYPDDGVDAETLVKNADAAMHHAKKTGRGNYRFFTHEMNARAFEALALEASMRRALERDEFSLVYQPQVAAATGRLVGIEALLRWRHPEFGELSPSRFVPLAEESGLIVPIGEWVLREACRQNRSWQDIGLPPVRVAVNLSLAQLRDARFAGNLRGVLSDTGLDSRYLELEVTESVIMHDAAQAAAQLRELKSLGIQLSVDDFGTGYSSLAYLKRFAIDRLKIDQSFVRDILTDANDVAIVRSIIGLGRNLGIAVLAEGVESGEQFAFLRDAGCNEAQGYCVAAPMSAEAFTRWFQTALSGGALPSPAYAQPASL